ncbi:hypothetical protein BDW22DRAFT_1352899 [Trametopsis cervina]|nr:hypothetical protein BDW22DRAFT_1352899 [Trametopsis cervina]
MLGRRDGESSFFGGQERVGMILLICVATVSLAALGSIMFVRRRPSQFVVLQTVRHPRRQHHEDAELTLMKPNMHDLYIEHWRTGRDLRWQSLMPMSAMDTPPTPTPPEALAKSFPIQPHAAPSDHISIAMLIEMPISPSSHSHPREQLQDLPVCIGLATAKPIGHWDTSC